MAISIKNYFDIDSSRNIRVRNKMRMIWIIYLFGIMFFGSFIVWPFLYAGLVLIPVGALTLYALMEGKNFLNYRKPLGIAYILLAAVTFNLVSKVCVLILHLQSYLLTIAVNIGFAVFYFLLIWLLVFRKR
ncbi:hypothetical protein [Mucilaginibacter myungsuensis]|uniref:Uncharacterized protein n=1 Tax=Mucilaginibacter myungsuensis TaxID=649104 RepID=A0A929PYH7_9SPHI|nr:hypothetical protein [Mucilaginibacter myungsuensis]MBE9664281.1 hypothetical protein [Mucilaginibacter myungsuensis]MDN3599985.1 hypothetical protein [Mucilaginibacter myungsuensis]